MSQQDLHHQQRSAADMFQLISFPFRFSGRFLMVYSKVKLKNRGDKASSYFRPLWIGNILRTQKYLLI
jgi:hypothetical protein